MRLHLEGDGEKKLLRYAQVTGTSIPMMVSKILDSALAEMPSDQIIFPLKFELKTQKKG